MRRLIYLDSLVLRRLVLVDQHYEDNQREQLRLFYKKMFGISCQFAECPYLFLEFIGCTKKKLGLQYTPSTSIDPNMSLGSLSDSQIKEIDQALVKELKRIVNHVKKQLKKQKRFIKERIKITETKSLQDPFSQKLINNSCRRYFWLFKKKFSTFLDIFTKALAWDLFVTIESPNLKILRERQLGYWYQNYNHEYPFGKIIDDLTSYYAHDFPKKNFLLKAREDMVDSKMMTLAVTGVIKQDNTHRVDVITFDTNMISERAKLALGALKNIEKSLNIPLQKKFGHIFCLSETNNENDPFNVEIIQNQNIIHL